MLTLLDSSAVLLKGAHILIIAGNAGTFQRSVRQICTDTENLTFCFLGLIFFSLFVRMYVECASAGQGRP